MLMHPPFDLYRASTTCSEPAATHGRLHIVGETLVDVNHCLMAAPGVAKEEIRRVISHPQVRAPMDVKQQMPCELTAGS